MIDLQIILKLSLSKLNTESLRYINRASSSNRWILPKLSDFLVEFFTFADSNEFVAAAGAGKVLIQTMLVIMRCK